MLGLFPKLDAIVASIPNAVLGGAGIAMFGMIVASGIRSLGKVSFDGNHNLMLVAISIGAVSYTHLDVYKRQERRSVKRNL